MSVVLFNGGLDTIKLKLGGAIINFLKPGSCFELVNIRRGRHSYDPEPLAKKFLRNFKGRGLVLLRDGDTAEAVSPGTRIDALDALVEHLENSEVNWEQMNEERKNAQTREITHDKYMKARIQDKKRAAKMADRLHQEMEKTDAAIEKADKAAENEAEKAAKAAEEAVGGGL